MHDLRRFCAAAAATTATVAVDAVDAVAAVAAALDPASFVAETAGSRCVNEDAGWLGDESAGFAI